MKVEKKDPSVGLSERVFLSNGYPVLLASNLSKALFNKRMSFSDSVRYIFTKGFGSNSNL